MSNQ
jgi:exonuclease III